MNADAIVARCSHFDERTGLMGEMGFTAAHTPAEAMVHETGHVVASMSDRTLRAFNSVKYEVYSSLKKKERALISDVGSTMWALER